MKEFPVEDYIPEAKTQTKQTKKRPEGQKTRGQEILRAIEIFDRSVRELHRPLDREEARKLEAVIDEMGNSSPSSDDTIMIHKLLDLIARENLSLRSDAISQHGEERKTQNIILGSRSNPLEIAFRLGMAYERIETKTSS